MMNPAEKILYLDRRIAGDSPGVTAVFAGGFTTWTLPYSVSEFATEGELAVVRRDTNERVTTAVRPSNTTIRVQGDFTAIPVYIGILYEQKYTVSTIYFRDGEDSPETRGRLQLRYVDIHYAPSTDFTVRVYLEGRTYTEYAVSHAAPKSGLKRVPVSGQNTQATIEVINDTPGGCALAGFDWEGFYTTRSRRY